VPVPEAGSDGRKRYQIHLKSDSGQIFVLLVNKDAADSNPVAVQVPPPKEIADAISGELELANAASAGGVSAARYQDDEHNLGAPAAGAKRTVTDTGGHYHLPPKLLKQEQTNDFDFVAAEEEGEGVRSSSIDLESLKAGPQDFTMPTSMGTEIPGLDELMASESKLTQWNVPVYTAIFIV
jgi:hypothetical protein